MRASAAHAACAACCALVACSGGQRPATDREQAVHRRALVMDAHSDITEAIAFGHYDFARRHPSALAHQDLPRIREGGLDAQLFAIWIDGDTGKPDRFWREAERELSIARDRLSKVPGVVLARTAAEVRAAKERGQLAALFGVEGGHMLAPGSPDEQLARLRRFAELGVRYMTITHSVSNDLGGSSGDKGRTRGLTDLGRAALAEMERLGIVADVSHVSDATFWDVVRAAKKPVLATHSSSRQLANVARNVTDAMAEAIAQTGGAVCVTFVPGFLDAGYHARAKVIEEAFEKELGPRAKEPMPIFEHRRLLAPRLKGLPRVTVEQVADHVQHLVAVAGADHVCVGSDFDGITVAPEGLEDVSKLPRLTAELLRRGMSESDVTKILGANLLRVLEAAEPR